LLKSLLRNRERLPESFRRSRELFAFARFVYNNSTNVLDSSPLVNRAIHLLFETLLKTRNASSRAMADEVKRLNDEHHVFVFPLWEQLDLLEKANLAFLDPDAALTANQLDQYAELMARLPEIYTLASKFLRGRALRPDQRRRAAVLRTLVPVTLVLASLAWALAPSAYRLTFKDGIQASFYDGENFEELVAQRTDWSIDFAWGNDPPHPGVPADHYSVRWKGAIRVPRDGQYTFYLRSDDGSRLYVAGKLLLDRWSLQNDSMEATASVALREGYVPITAELFEHDGGSGMHLEWSAPWIPKAVIEPKYWAH
jgi:hypothetical protein